MSKADYVRAERDSGHDGTHHCHWPRCDKKVSPAQWGCWKHWRMLPAEIQRPIWRAFQPGQEKTKTPSREYIDAAQAAQRWIMQNHPPERTLL